MCVPIACTCGLSMTMECIVPFCFTAVIQVNFNQTDYSVSENAGNVVLTLLANQPASFDYTVQVDTVNGAAVGQLLSCLHTQY